MFVSIEASSFLFSSSGFLLLLGWVFIGPQANTLKERASGVFVPPDPLEMIQSSRFLPPFPESLFEEDMARKAKACCFLPSSRVSGSKSNGLLNSLHLPSSKGYDCSKEVVWGSSADHGFAGAGTWVKLQAVGGVVSTDTETAMSEQEISYKVYFKCSSISMIAAWFPHL